jgi:iron complex outermembrane receptor protein
MAAEQSVSSNKVLNFSEYVDDYDNGNQKMYSYDNGIFLFHLRGRGGYNHFVAVKKTEISLISKYVGRQYLDNTGNQARSLDDYYVQDSG